MDGPTEPRRLRLEVRFDCQPIEGRLSDEHDRFTRPFSGWMGLMAAIEAAGNRPSGDVDGEARSHAPYPQRVRVRYERSET